MWGVPVKRCLVPAIASLLAGMDLHDRVWRKIERVNIRFQWMDTALRLKPMASRLFRIVNRTEPALRRDQIDNLFQMLMGFGCREHEGWSANFQRGDRLAVIDYMMRAKGFHPVLRFRPRSGGDDSQIGECTNELDGN